MRQEDDLSEINLFLYTKELKYKTNKQKLTKQDYMKIFKVSEEAGEMASAAENKCNSGRETKFSSWHPQWAMLNCL